MAEKTGFYGDVGQAINGHVDEASGLQNIFSSRQASTLTDDEIELLAGYQILDSRGKARVLGFIDGIAPARSSLQVEFHGNVGQQVMGNITAPQTFNMGGGKKKKKADQE